jgi:hypothetical protein
VGQCPEYFQVRLDRSKSGVTIAGGYEDVDLADAEAACRGKQHQLGAD